MEKRIVIAGAAAREITQHVRTYVLRHAGRSWAEVQGMDECKHGCKLYVRRQGAILRYALWHSPSYGCDLGRDADTRTVPVSVRPRG